MKVRELLEKDYPYEKDIRHFAKEHTALFLGICAALATTAMFVINSLEYAYKLGYYHFGFNVSQVYLGEIRATSIPFSVVCGVVGFIFLIMYANMAWNAYLEYRLKKFILIVSLVIVLFYLYITGIPFVNELMVKKIVPDFRMTVYFILEILLLVVLTLILISVFAICIILNKTDSDKLKRIKNGIKWVDEKKNKTRKICKKIRSNYLDKKAKKLEKKQIELERKIQGNIAHTVKGEPQKLPIFLRWVIFAIVITYTIAFILLPMFGILHAAMNDEFEIIYTDSISSDQETQLDSDINGLVKLYQYDDKVIASPCTYTNDKIIVYTAIQHVVHVEDITFVHKRFPNHLVR